MKEGDQCSIQWEDESLTTRWLYEIVSVTKSAIHFQSLSDTEVKKILTHHVLVVALPNKRSKAELIIQKLSEIWLSRVIFFPAQRSQFRSLPEKKLQRMREISKEATEQSWWWRTTSIEFVGSIEDVCTTLDWVDYEVCDIMPDEYIIPAQPSTQKHKRIVFVWPEWWRWPQDYEILDRRRYWIMSLWKSVLRMETAAIIAWWRAVNAL